MRGPLSNLESREHANDILAELLLNDSVIREKLIAIVDTIVPVDRALLILPNFREVRSSPAAHRIDEILGSLHELLSQYTGIRNAQHVRRTDDASHCLAHL